MPAPLSRPAEHVTSPALGQPAVAGIDNHLRRLLEDAAHLDQPERKAGAHPEVPENVNTSLVDRAAVAAGDLLAAARNHEPDGGVELLPRPAGRIVTAEVVLNRDRPRAAEQLAILDDDFDVERFACFGMLRSAAVHRAHLRPRR